MSAILLDILSELCYTNIDNGIKERIKRASNLINFISVKSHGDYHTIDEVQGKAFEKLAYQLHFSAFIHIIVR